MTYIDYLNRPLVDRTDVICDQCEGAILESEKRTTLNDGEIICTECIAKNDYVISN